MANQGFENEKLIAEALNKKLYSQINPNLQTMIKSMFGYRSLFTHIKCVQSKPLFKPDIEITYKGMTKYVSVKMGHANMVHGEDIKTFILFLRSIGVSKETQKTILLFHYGDGTMDGSGKKRLNQADTFQWLRTRIKEANDELNNNYEIIEKVMNRVMYQGIDPLAHAVDYIYFGTPEYGVTVSKKQITTYVKRKSWNYFDFLHIGPIFLKPHARYSKKHIVDEKRHNTVHCYWPNLSEDLDRISRRYTF